MDYNKTKIYKIWSTQGPKIYIGSTTKEYLSQRMTRHRSAYVFYKKLNKGYLTSFILFDEYGIENCFIELIEAKPCNNIDEVKQLEGKYIRSLDCVNKRIEDRNKEEKNELNKKLCNRYYKNNKNELNKINKEYYQTNKDNVLIQMLIKIKCECGCEISKCHLNRHLKTKKHLKYIEDKF
jgi:hypothetical protein